ncbi:MAG TPA: hypothetical protein PLZ10_07075, partial [Chitinophagaceae bacterium]|nr:hypothetical protein [Chitinophagaceae bacterium]
QIKGYSTTHHSGTKDGNFHSKLLGFKDTKGRVVEPEALFAESVSVFSFKRYVELPLKIE